MEILTNNEKWEENNKNYQQFCHTGVTVTIVTTVADFHPVLLY